MIAVVVDLLLADAHGQEDVPAAHDRLKGVVRVQPQSAPRKESRENVAGRRDALACSAANGEREVELR